MALNTFSYNYLTPLHFKGLTPGCVTGLGKVLEVGSCFISCSIAYLSTGSAYDWPALL